jgi:hypothetical protein
VSVADILWRANILAISFTLQQGKIQKMKFFLEGIERFIEDYLRNLTCWEKIKYGYVIGS